MNSLRKYIPSWLAPILGAGAIGVCPLCWAGSAALLTYLGLGALIPAWPWVAGFFLSLGLIGFLFDYRSHKSIWPLVLLIVGAILLFVERYVFVGKDFGYWPIWGLGGVLIVIAVVFNKRLFRKPTSTVNEAATV